MRQSAELATSCEVQMRTRVVCAESRLRDAEFVPQTAPECVVHPEIGTGLSVNSLTVAVRNDGV